MKKYILVITLLFASYYGNCQWLKLDSLSQRVYCFASNGFSLFAGTITGGVFISNDNGNTWFQINNGLTTSNIRSIVIKDSNIFAGAEGGVFLSINNGTSWMPVNNGLTNLDVSNLIIKDNNIYAATDDGVFSSSNNGTNWIPISNGLNELIVYRLILRDTCIFAGTYHDGIYFSNNNGANWIEINIGVPTNPWNFDLCSIMSFTQNNAFIYASAWSRGIISSSNNGENWNILNVLNYYIWSLASKDSIIIAGHDGIGITISKDNGINWITFNDGLTDFVVYSIFIKDNYVFAGTENGYVFRRSLSDITGIDENNNPISNKIYPNPNNGILFITSFSYISSIDIYNVIGEMVGNILYYNQQKSREVDILYLPKGLYFIKIHNGEMIQTKIIIKQ